MPLRTTADTYFMVASARSHEIGEFGVVATMSFPTIFCWTDETVASSCKVDGGEVREVFRRHTAFEVLEVQRQPHLSSGQLIMLISFEAAFDWINALRHVGQQLMK
jgi:hypothetical protein